MTVNPLEAALDGPQGIRARLHELRAQAGIQQQELAQRAGWHPSKVSRIENGKTKPSTADVRAWVLAVGGGNDLADELIGIMVDAEAEHRTWRASMRRGQAPVQAAYHELAVAAHTIKHFEMTAVPGIVQTAGYARAIFDEMVKLHGLPVSDVDQAVTARIERQELLYSDRRFELLLAQPVLEWLLCPPDVMRSQLMRLHSLIGMPNVRFGVLPTRVQLHAIPQNSTVAYISDDETIVEVETFAADTLYYGQEAAAFVAAIDRLWADAVEGEAVRQFLNDAASALPTG